MTAPCSAGTWARSRGGRTPAPSPGGTSPPRSGPRTSATSPIGRRAPRRRPRSHEHSTIGTGGTPLCARPGRGHRSGSRRGLSRSPRASNEAPTPNVSPSDRPRSSCRRRWFAMDRPPPGPLVMAGHVALRCDRDRSGTTRASYRVPTCHRGCAAGCGRRPDRSSTRMPGSWSPLPAPGPACRARPSHIRAVPWSARAGHSGPAHAARRSPGSPAGCMLGRRGSCHAALMMRYRARCRSEETEFSDGDNSRSHELPATTSLRRTVARLTLRSAAHSSSGLQPVRTPGEQHLDDSAGIDGERGRPRPRLLIVATDRTSRTCRPGR